MTDPDYNFSFVTPNPNVVIVVEPVRKGEHPSYEIRGYTRCMGPCDRRCWLGSESLRIVGAGKATPLCAQCAAPVIPSAVPLGVVTDQSE